MFTLRLTRAPRYVLIKSFFLAIRWRYLHDLSPTFLKRLKLLRGEIACQKRFVFYRKRPNIKIYLFLLCISYNKNFIPKYLDNALTDSVLTSRISRRLLEEKAAVNDFVRTVPGEKYMIGNGVISLLWELRCHCNPDHSKFISLFNTTVASIFPNLCLWRLSLCSNLGGTDPEKTVSSHLNAKRRIWKIKDLLDILHNVREKCCMNIH